LANCFNADLPPKKSARGPHFVAPLLQAISAPWSTINLNRLEKADHLQKPLKIRPVSPLLSRFCKEVLWNLIFSRIDSFYPAENRELLYRNTLFFFFFMELLPALTETPGLKFETEQSL
jgi:hypothetical protein